MARKYGAQLHRPSVNSFLSLLFDYGCREFEHWCVGRAKLGFPPLLNFVFRVSTASVYLSSFFSVTWIFYKRPPMCHNAKENGVFHRKGTLRTAILVIKCFNSKDFLKK